MVSQHSNKTLRHIMSLNLKNKTKQQITKPVGTGMFPGHVPLHTLSSPELCKQSASAVGCWTVRPDFSDTLNAQNCFWSCFQRPFVSLLGKLAFLLMLPNNE